MEPMDDVNLDRLLAAHVARELDPQRGRALAAFEAAMATGRRARNHRRFLAALATFATLAAAAAVAFYVGNRPAVPKPAVPQVARTVEPVEDEVDERPRAVEQFLAWRTVDEGIILLTDDRPVRRMRQQVIEQLRVYDEADHSYVELTRPREDVFYVNVQTY
jgi:hypothetical protein